MTNKVDVTISINGHTYTRNVESRRLLSDFIRHDVGLSGTHVGCEHGVCGACTVIIDERPVRSCLMFAIQAEGLEVTTVEGIGTTDDLHPIQEAFWEVHGLQCGFCTPGILMTVIPFLKESPNPSDEEIREMLTGNLCRCTGYQHIIDSVRLAAEKLSA